MRSSMETSSRFSRMEQDKVYEDDRYVIYDMTDLFYTDLDAYLDDLWAL